MGHRQLLLPGITAVVLDGDGRVLLNRRADNGRWSLIGGIAEPGEQPADTAVREVLEETGVRVVAERVVLVQTIDPVLYPNGDRCQYVDITFRCHAVGGRARVADDESLEVGWFDVDGLPDLRQPRTAATQARPVRRPHMVRTARGIAAGVSVLGHHGPCHECGRRTHRCGPTVCLACTA